MVKFDFCVYAQKIRERYNIPFIKTQICQIEVATQECTAIISMRSNEETQNINIDGPEAKIASVSQPSKKVDQAEKRRPRSTITKCSHGHRKHYAKGLCRQCYHIFGRKNLATGCKHTSDINYARNLCISCYNHEKYLRRKMRRQLKE